MGFLKRVVLGISGGIDSSVAALLLKNKGYEVIGLFMRNWDIKDEQGYCSSDQDAEDAEWVCKKLSIPFHEVSFVKEYWNEVFSYLMDDYQNGRTPNPDIYCNKFIKFNHFLNYAQEKFDADAISTGHYARSSFGQYLEHFDSRTGAKLLKAADPIKDQTFFLSQIAQEALQQSMFPLGDITKNVTRQIALSNDLKRIWEKRESAGICFIGKRNFSSFIQEYIDDKPGDFVDIDTNKVLGKHRGFHHYTLGQGCGLQGGLPDKYYTVSKDMKTNVIYIAAGWEHPSLFCSSLLVNPLHFIHQPPEELTTKGQIECQFRFQHGHSLVPCILATDLTEIQAKENENCYTINLFQPLRALTPGQFSVLYKGDECIGSSSIIKSGPSLYDIKINRSREEQII